MVQASCCSDKAKDVRLVVMELNLKRGVKRKAEDRLLGQVQEPTMVTPAQEAVAGTAPEWDAFVVRSSISRQWKSSAAEAEANSVWLCSSPRECACLPMSVIAMLQPALLCTLVSNSAVLLCDCRQMTLSCRQC